MCKVTHCVQSYTLCVKLHTEYKSSFTFIVKKFPSLEIFYTHAVTDVTDKYEVCLASGSLKSHFYKFWFYQHYTLNLVWCMTLWSSWISIITIIKIIIIISPFTPCYKKSILGSKQPVCGICFVGPDCPNICRSLLIFGSIVVKYTIFDIP